MSTVVAMLNRKGGVGKTSACHHLAGAAVRLGRRPLLADLDPQASLTQGLLGPAAAAAVPAAASVAAAWRDDGRPAAGCVVRVPLPPPARGRPPAAVDLLPGHPEAADWNDPRPDRCGDRQTALRDWLGPVAAGYDLVLLDCPPNLQLLARAAVAAAGGVVVPLQPEDYGAQGIAAVAAEVRAVRAALHPGVTLLGYLLTMRMRTALHDAYAGQLRAAHGPLVFAAEVPRAVAYVESVVARTPVGLYRPRSAAAKIMDLVCQELLDRAAAAAAGKGVAA